jgi:hypothetical protein
MPKQNRINPFGEIISTPHRGTVFGNRGCLHDSGEQILRQYAVKRWIICKLEFKGRHRPIMAPNQYTELFFLDEATALSAGHRPCAECNRPKYNRFLALWAQANPALAGNSRPSAGQLDQALHKERLTPAHRKATFSAQLSTLPAGCFITFSGSRQPYLVLADALLAWTLAGYQAPITRPTEATVEVLTPASVVRTLAAGYQPDIYLA